MIFSGVGTYSDYYPDDSASRTPFNLSNQGSSKGRLWLLVKGVTKPPSGIQAVRKKAANGHHLHGMKYDFAIMQSWIRKNPDNQLFNTVENMRALKRQQVRSEFHAMCAAAKNNGYPSVCVYYSGHGEKGTGNWAFADGTISLDDLHSIRKQFYPVLGLNIIADCCYSGEWVERLAKYPEYYPNTNVEAASFPKDIAHDTPYGAAFSLFRFSSQKNEKPVYWCKGMQITGKDGNQYVYKRYMLDLEEIEDPQYDAFY